jgi:hypothetical protein
MAAGRDIRRETVRIRREQARRNAEAIAAAEQRRAEMDAKSGKLSPGSGRRREVVFASPKPTVVRQGHRVAYKDPTPPDPWKGVEFASPRARELAEEAGLTSQSFTGRKPSGAGGYTAGDVRDAMGDPGDKDAKGGPADDDENGGGGGSGDKKDRTGYEDKMQRHAGGEDK